MFLKKDVLKHGRHTANSSSLVKSRHRFQSHYDCLADSNTLFNAHSPIKVT